MESILGIDVGGSGIKGAPVDISTGKLLRERVRFETPAGAIPSDVATTVLAVKKHFSWRGWIGLALPFRVKEGVAKTAANIDASWIGTNARRLFATATGCKVAVINDADAAGLAEMTFGAGRGQRGTVLVLTVGTGIGSSLFVNSRLVPNTELGHLRMRDTIAEAWAANSARKRDELSWPEWAERFQEYLSYAEFLFAPDLIIIGGGVSRPKRTVQYLHLLKTDAALAPALLQNEAGIIGAACAARN